MNSKVINFSSKYAKYVLGALLMFLTSNNKNDTIAKSQIAEHSKKTEKHIEKAKRFDDATTLLLTQDTLKNKTDTVAQQPAKPFKEQLVHIFDDDSFRLLVATVQAEAGNQGKEGMKMVAHVILNRLESPRFPNTIKGVVSQPHQFDVWPRVANKKDLKQEAFDAVNDVLVERSINIRNENDPNRKVYFFKIKSYHSGYEHITKVGAHYFSGLRLTKKSENTKEDKQKPSEKDMKSIQLASVANQYTDR